MAVQTGFWEAIEQANRSALNQKSRSQSSLHLRQINTADEPRRSTAIRKENDLETRVAKWTLQIIRGANEARSADLSRARSRTLTGVRQFIYRTSAIPGKRLGESKGPLGSTTASPRDEVLSPIHHRVLCVNVSLSLSLEVDSISELRLLFILFSLCFFATLFRLFFVTPKEVPCCRLLGALPLHLMPVRASLFLHRLLSARFFATPRRRTLFFETFSIAPFFFLFPFPFFFFVRENA